MPEVIHSSSMINFQLMEVSSVSLRVSPGQLRSGMIFCAKSPTLGDKLLSNFPRGRGSFHAKVLVLFIKNGRLPLQLIKKNTEKTHVTFSLQLVKKNQPLNNKDFLS